ncbi:hypothetical protein ACIRYZ_35690 [Kitasatospora sp. NPDC101155]|uniref:hypothetical protein n=1 Tax=Kitasatospora sp. NPDC101155 TaxID=3364097 RepID=UPI0037F66D77
MDRDRRPDFVPVSTPSNRTVNVGGTLYGIKGDLTRGAVDGGTPNPTSTPTRMATPTATPTPTGTPTPTSGACTAAPAGMRAPPMRR